MMDDLISREAAIDTLAIGEELLRRVLDDMDVVGNEREKYEWGLGLIESYISDMKDLPSAQPTLYGYNIDHLELIASVLRKEGLPPERVAEALTDIGRIVAIVRDEFAETLRKAVER